MEWILIVLIIVLTIILIGVNFYLLALYIHQDDKGLGNVLYTKILVIIGLTLAQATVLMVPLDVANKSAILSDSLNMATFWFIVYIVILVFISVMIPYAIFFYQTDQDDGICKRLGKAFLFTLGAIIVTCLLLFISWAILRYVDIPYQEIKISKSQTYGPGKSVPQPTRTSLWFTLETSLAVYIIAILSFFGWIFLVLFGAVGIFALPIDLINQFRHRPKPRKSAQMRQHKDKLVAAINGMIQQGQDLKQQQKQHQANTQVGFFAKWREGRSIGTKFNQFKIKYHQLQQQFKIFNLQLKYNDTNPVIPFLKLILGIIFILTSLLWIIQIFLGNVLKGYYGRPLIPFFNQLLIYMQQKNAGFVGTAVFGYLALYMLWCVQKGNIKFGIRVPCCCRFHPMKQNQTWMNSFMFNVILLLIASVGVIQLCISSFPTYTRNTEIYMILGVQINYMRLYSFFYNNTIFHIAFLVWALITLIYQLITCNKKPDYLRQIQRIRKNEVQQ